MTSLLPPLFWLAVTMFIMSLPGVCFASLQCTGRLQCDCHLSRVIYKNIFTTKHLITLIHQLLKQHLTTASSGDNNDVDDENQECVENHLLPPSVNWSEFSQSGWCRSFFMTVTDSGGPSQPSQPLAINLYLYYCCCPSQGRMIGS